MRGIARTPLAVPTSLSWSAQIAAGQYAISAAHNRKRHAVLSSHGKHTRRVSQSSATEQVLMVREAEAPQQPPQKPMQQQKQEPAWITWYFAKVVPVLGAFFLFYAIGLLSIAPLDLSAGKTILGCLYNAAWLLDLVPSAYKLIMTPAALLASHPCRLISLADVFGATIVAIFMYAFIDVFPQIFQPKRQPPRATSGDKGNDRKPKLKAGALASERPPGALKVNIDAHMQA